MEVRKESGQVLNLCAIALSGDLEFTFYKDARPDLFESILESCDENGAYETEDNNKETIKGIVGEVLYRDDNNSLHAFSFQEYVRLEKSNRIKNIDVYEPLKQDEIKSKKLDFKIETYGLRE